MENTPLGLLGPLGPVGRVGRSVARAQPPIANISILGSVEVAAERSSE